MKDLSIALEHRPGALAEMGEALARAGVSIEGGGAFVVDGSGVAHFLFDDGPNRAPGVGNGGHPGAGGTGGSRAAPGPGHPRPAGRAHPAHGRGRRNIEVLYSDHDHRLILVVDDAALGRSVADAWERAARAAGRRTS